MDCSLSGGATPYLDALYEEYENFDVQQTTVAVNPDEFEAIDSHPEGIAVRIELEGEGGVLALPDGEDWSLPGGVVDRTPDRERIAALATRHTGVRCEIDTLRRVSLVCLQCEVVDDEVWTLEALFSATPTGGIPRKEAAWLESGEAAIPNL